MFAPFSQPWSESLGAALNASERYATAARNWRGALLLANADAPGEAAFLDLHEGRCRAARAAGSDDWEQARFVLSAPLDTWRRILTGELGAVEALMKRQIRLDKGRLTQLVPHAAATREFLACAGAVATEFSPNTAGVEAGSARATSTAPGGSRRFVSLVPGALDRETLPQRLWAKARRDGIWNPADIDFAVDREQWQSLRPDEQRLLLQLAALFGAGEESVTVDLLPLIQVIAAEGRLDEEMYLTSFLWEEAKHVEAFYRFFVEVARFEGDLDPLLTPSHRRIFEHELPTSMRALREDSSPVAQARASATYNLIVEGVLAETGYHSYYQVLQRHDILPGMQQVVRYLQADESRHLAYGVFLLSRLIAEHGDAVWEAVDRRLEELFEPAVGIVHETFDQYRPDIPFGLEPEHFLEFAADQFGRRRARIEKARGQTLEQVLREPAELP